MNWISTRTVNHASCGKTRDPSSMPTRLLNLGDSASDPHVRLAIYAEYFQGHNKDDEANSKTHSFITLSARWGRVEMPKLETSNESTFRQSINLLNSCRRPSNTLSN
jgi:hypothetical protein